MPGGAGYSWFEVEVVSYPVGAIYDGPLLVVVDDRPFLLQIGLSERTVAIGNVQYPGVDVADVAPMFLAVGMNSSRASAIEEGLRRSVKVAENNLHRKVAIQEVGLSKMVIS